MDFIVNLWNTIEVRRALISLLVLLIAFILWKVIKRLIRSFKAKRGTGEISAASASSIASVISDTVKVTVVAVLILVILQINGVNVTSLVAGVGVLSAVIGLALQDFLKDIIMGIHVLMDDFFQIGDMVQYEDAEGTVVSFNLRTTKIRSLSNSDIITICNRNITKITKSSTEVYVRIPLPFDVPVGRSAELMQKICETIGASDEHIEKASFLGTTDYTSSAVEHLIRLDIESPEFKLSTRRSALRASREVLEAHHIEIPFEQLSVHIDGVKNSE